MYVYPSVAKLKRESWMKQFPRKYGTIAVLSAVGTIALFVTHLLFAGIPQAGASNPASGMEPVPAIVPISALTPLR